MGRYIAFRAEYTEASVLPDVLAATVNHMVFRPCAIGAIDYRTCGARLFLSGFGLESFVTREGPENVSSFYVDKSVRDPEYLPYMKRLTDWIRHGYSPKKDLSPHEKLESDHLSTFLTSPALGTASIAEYEKWAQEGKNIGIYLYGTFALSVCHPNACDWSNAYRFLFEDDYPELGAPFLMLFAHRRSESTMGPLTVTVFTESLVWLRGCLDLNGQVSNACADHNLGKLVKVAELLFASKRHVKRTGLSVESQTFRRDYERIEHAFAHLLT